MIAYVSWIINRTLRRQLETSLCQAILPGGLWPLPSLWPALSCLSFLQITPLIRQFQRSVLEETPLLTFESHSPFQSFSLFLVFLHYSIYPI